MQTNNLVQIEKAVVVVGCGEIGMPIVQLCQGGFAQVICEDPAFCDPGEARYPVAALHVAIAGSLPNFVEVVDGYVRKYHPDVILISSSTVPGFTDTLVEAFGQDMVVHTQVHGKHKGDRMRSDMLRHPKFVATQSDVAFDKARDIFIAMGHPPDRIHRLSSPLAGELTKLLATTYYGYLIAWTQEVERMSDQSGVSYEDLMAFTKLETDDFDIDNKFPGVIGGHCVMPNIAILKKSYPSPIWDFIEKSNEMKKARGDG
jgi:UDP-N-acetyl-D-mannosaminuronate dehydrogenase